jgi:hypothetical protein
VLETRDASANAIRRRHACRGCGKSFTTIQRVEVYHDGAWLPAPLAVVPDAHVPAPLAPVAPRRRAASPAPDRLHPLHPDKEWMPSCTRDIPEAMFCDLLKWWNESRWDKHRTQATWTQAAFTLSANRVNLLCQQGQHHIARALVEAGIEHGWQALKPEYLRGITPAAPPAAAPAGDPAAAAIRDMLERADAA